MIALAAEGVSVRVAGAMILARVDLEVSAGEILGIFGPSGAGKSTLFRALVGELGQPGEPRLDAGLVRIAGEDVTRLPLWKRARLGLGYLPQTPSVLVDLTVEENLAVFRTLGPRGDRGPKDVLEALGLADRRDVRASALSGGERRRLELARVLSSAPSVLVCDEPFAGMDPNGAARAGELVRRAADAGAGVILSDHHVATALALCDRAALLLAGEIARVATPEAFSADPLVRMHYAGHETPRESA